MSERESVPKRESVSERESVPKRESAPERGPESKQVPAATGDGSEPEARPRPPAPRKPFVRATPNPVPVGPGLGKTTIEWVTGDGRPGWVYVRQGDQAPKLLAHGTRGRKTVDWIDVGQPYRFTLYADEERRQKLASVTVTKKAEVAPAAVAPPPPAAAQTTTKPFIRANPNPIPVRAGPGATEISWATGTEHPGWVYLETANHQHQLFASGREGRQVASWVQRDVPYKFSLYGDPGRKLPLAKVTVAMGSPARAVALDVAFIVGIALAALAPVVLLLLLLRWAVRGVGMSARPGAPAARA